jgi:hypothetical protein
VTTLLNFRQKPRPVEDDANIQGPHEEFPNWDVLFYHCNSHQKLKLSLSLTKHTMKSGGLDV